MSSQLAGAAGWLSAKPAACVAASPRARRWDLLLAGPESITPVLPRRGQERGVYVMLLPYALAAFGVLLCLALLLALSGSPG